MVLVLITLCVYWIISPFCILKRLVTRTPRFFYKELSAKIIDLPIVFHREYQRRTVYTYYVVQVWLYRIVYSSIRPNTNKIIGPTNNFHVMLQQKITDVKY